jgi:hypothetical protein
MDEVGGGGQVVCPAAAGVSGRVRDCCDGVFGVRGVGGGEVGVGQVER